MRRLIAILLMLWLPLQAVAGSVVPACASHSAVRHGVTLDGVPAQSAAHQAHAKSMGEQAGKVQADDGVDGIEMTAADGLCGYCALGCAAHVQADAKSGAQSDPGAGPTRHGDEVYTSAAADRALEPPITAA